MWSYYPFTHLPAVGAYIHRLHLSIDAALGVSYRRNVYDGDAKYVARITLVKGVPFYGFHVGYKFYLKIYMLNPMVMTRLADILRQGGVMKKVFQPYEAHLQYLLQWMADYNLYGCGYIDCKKVTFRAPVPIYEELNNSSHLWHDLTVPDELVTDESVLPRVSHCSLEVDICVQDILNRRDVKARLLHHDFVERLHPLAPDEKLVHSMAGLWKDETRRRKLKMSYPQPGSSPFPAEVLISMSADPRNSQPGGWIHEAEYREKIEALILDEKTKSDGANISFSTFVKKSRFESYVKTSLEAVEDLYPENLRPALGLTQGTKYDINEQFETEVDQNRILGFGLSENDGFYDSDEEIMREIELSQQMEGDHVEEKYVGPEDVKKVEHRVDDENCPSGDDFAAQFLDPPDPADSNLLEKHSSSSGYSNAPPGPNEARSALDTSDAGYISVSPISEKFKPRIETSTHVMKRSGSAVKQVDTLTKRQRVSFGDVAPMDHDTPEAPIACPKPRTVNEFSLQPETSLTRKSSQESLKARSDSQTQSLGFPVVKDPHDPESASRLSQKSASQPSPAERKKHSTWNLSLLSSSQANAPSLMNSSLPVSTQSSLPMSKAIKHMRQAFLPASTSTLLAFGEPPPSSLEILSTMQDFNLPSAIYQDAFFSNEADVPARPREWAGREFKLGSSTVPYLADFDPTASSDATFGRKQASLPDKLKEEREHDRRRRACGLRSWQIAEVPPSFSEVNEWLRDVQASNSATAAAKSVAVHSGVDPVAKGKLSQIDGPTQKNEYGFKYTQNQATSNVQHEAQYMSTMSLEVHVNTRGNFVPNPEEDEVQCLFWCLQSDEEGFLETNNSSDGTHVGIVVLSEDGSIAEKVSRQAAVQVQEESSELDLIIRMVENVRAHDPDILTGYEVHGGSWGYLIERARLKYDYNLCDEFSRVKAQSHGRFGKDNDKWGFNHTSTIRVTGRHMINIWRAMRSELNLLQYTLENVAFHLLHRRVPHFTWADLTRWYTNGRPRDLAKVIKYYISRVHLNLEILEKNELIARTSEQARLLGVDFFSVFSRGSQFKVESLMFRIAKPENFMLVSPSRKQVGGQNALECLPLVMEPQSAFYNSPLLVLDFQSLYPSVMIAYNYCYSTFLGRVVNWRGTNKMGFTEFRRQQRLLELLKDHINIAPNGMMYTKPEIRKSLLAKMLGEILETRVMVKSGMKLDKDDKALQRLLNNRQLALKLIANVTYGYTSASFSGRMPCSEVADSIVQTGRETLEKAIALIHSVKRWGAEVVYGDTDSLFVYLKGRTKDQAFDIGEEIAKTVTNMNPRPIKLKFEKVYFPCVLLAKKRYVGFKYEHRNQVEPDFDAKGIETVRRDGTPAEQKMEEKALKILFRTADLSQVKSYFQKQCDKIMRGNVSVQDFCFAREVKLGTYSDKGPPPPGALISTKKMLEDARAEPQYGERVPYVVITGAPGARLIDRCVAPEVLLENGHCELDAEYYISKNIIPPLERIFNLVGANVRQWYDDMPKVQRIRRVDVNLQLQGQSSERATRRKTLESYMKSSLCVLCKEKLESGGPLCPACWEDKPKSMLSLQTNLNVEERKLLDLHKVCQSCSGISPLDEVTCDSKDCPVFYTRTRQTARSRIVKAMVEPIMQEISGKKSGLDLEW
jgi:DNA polymerase zeta